MGLKSIAKAAGKQANKLLGNIEKAELSVIVNTQEGDAEYVLKVPFNPSRLRYLASGEKIVQHSLRQSHLTDMRFNQSAKVISGQLSFQLIFDAVELVDAFMWEALQAVTNPSPTVLVKDATSIIKTAVKGPPSVMDAMYALTGVLMSDVKYVRFKWGEIDFTGTLSEVRSEYVMFSMRGEPIRGTVEMRLTQCASEKEVFEVQQKQFKKLFTDNVMNAKHVTKKAGNLVDLNL